MLRKVALPVRVALPFRVAVGVLFGLGYSSTSAAFCRTTTCEACIQPVPGCVTEGHVLFWPVTCVSYDVQKDASTTADFATADGIAGSAFGAWAQVVCPATGQNPSFQLMNYGPVACSKHEYNSQQDSQSGNANIVVFRDDAWTATPDPHTLALTTVTYNTNTGEIYDADIEVNSHIEFAGMHGISTQTPVPADTFDLQSILTHEAGHFFGLAHSDQPCSAQGGDCPTMDAMYRTGSGDFRTLEVDDIEGICAIYPPDRAASDNACVPRHGFSSECGGASKTGGCAISAGGASSRAGAALFAWLFGLGLLALRGRRTST
jgi:hypothetical protein